LCRPGGMSNCGLRGALGSLVIESVCHVKTVARADCWSQ
jgi:hypothetical protein